MSILLTITIAFLFLDYDFRNSALSLATTKKSYELDYNINRGKNHNCLDRNITPQPGFNLTKFIGRWHLLAQTLPTGIYALESGVTDQLYRGNGSFQIQHAGHNKNDCYGPLISEGWEDTEIPGYIHTIYINASGHRNSFMVVYTDYDNSVLYSCQKYDETGKRCAPEQAYVIINSRENKLVDVSKWCQMLKFIEEYLCVDPRLMQISPRRYECKHKLEKQLVDLDLDLTEHKRNYTSSMKRYPGVKSVVKRAMEQNKYYTEKGMELTKNLNINHEICLKRMNNILK